MSKRWTQYPAYLNLEYGTEDDGLPIIANLPVHHTKNDFRLAIDDFTKEKPEGSKEILDLLFFPEQMLALHIHYLDVEEIYWRPDQLVEIVYLTICASIEETGNDLVDSLISAHSIFNLDGWLAARKSYIDKEAKNAHR